MKEPTSFVTEFTSDDIDRVAFAWNGGHADEFLDANQDFRRSVANVCLSDMENAHPELARAIFLEEAKWSKEAWGAWNDFHRLAELLLITNGNRGAEDFVSGLYTSFDTYGACHQMTLPAGRISSLITELEHLISNGGEKDRLEGAIGLLNKIQDGNATEGWHTLSGETEVKNVSVVYPRWYHRLWHRIKAAFAKK